mgnify:CR=1 FL=1
MARKRLGENHPFMKKINALYDYMDREGISIEYPGGNKLLIIDHLNQQEYDLLDLDSSEPITIFPPIFEFKLTLDDTK